MTAPEKVCTISFTLGINDDEKFELVGYDYPTEHSTLKELKTCLKASFQIDAVIIDEKSFIIQPKYLGGEGWSSTNLQMIEKFKSLQKILSSKGWEIKFKDEDCETASDEEAYLRDLD